MRTHVRIWGWVLVFAAGVGLYAAWEEGLLGGRRQPSAVAAVERALAALKEDPSVWQTETRRLLRSAAVAAEETQLDTAEGHFLRGEQYARESDFTAAEAAYRRAIALNPTWPPAYVGLGTLLGAHAASRIDEAISLFRHATALAPDWSRPHNNLAIVLRRAGRLEEAEQAARHALELEPDSVATQNNYANLLVALQRFEEAEEVYRRAIATDPTHPKPYYNLACLYSLRGDAAAAAEMLQHAIAISPVFREEARLDADFEQIRDSPEFQALMDAPE